MIELSRLARQRSSKTLQGVAFFDEADAYVPAIGAPATKEPMFDLLRRARSGGLGVLLATAESGRLRLQGARRYRDVAGGKSRAVASDREDEESDGAYPNVGPRLANQPTGHFFVLANSKANEVRSDRSMMLTEQLPCQ